MDLIKKIEEIGGTYNRLQSKRASVPFEVVAEVHHMITLDSLHIAKNVTLRLNLLKNTDFRILY